MFDNEKQVKDTFNESLLNEKELLVEGRLLDYMIIYAIGIRFVKPFKKWKAYKHGLIDDKGKILKSPKTAQEKNAFTPLDNVILRIKRLIPMRLWYLLTAAYIFKGFMNRKFRQVESVTDESELLKIEEQNIEIEHARKKVFGIIRNNTKFTEEEFWSYVMNMKDLE